MKGGRSGHLPEDSPHHVEAIFMTSDEVETRESSDE